MERKRRLKTEPQMAKKDRVNTGVTINADLWKRLRALAIMQDKTAGALLDEAIREYIKRNEGVL